MSAGFPASRSRTTATATRRRSRHIGPARRAVPFFSAFAFIPPAPPDPSAAMWRYRVRYPPCEDDLTFPCDIIRCEHSPPR